jgi:hypothetical protein
MSLVVVSRGPLLRGALGAGLALLAIALGAPAATAATFTVSTTTDGAGTCTATGPCSLRQALDSAGNGDTVAVPAGTYTLDSANGQLDVSSGVTIDGAGQGSTMIVGPGNDRVMMIAGNATTVTISGLTITGGDTTSSGGGGIAAAGPGRVVLDDDTVAHNTVAPAAAGFDEGGGGILTSADMVLNQTTVNDNTVDVTASNGDSGGGGILVEQGGGTLTLNDSTISANTATVAANTAGETADNNGGGGIYMDGLDLTIDNSTVSQNTVTVTGSAQPAPADGGGGVYQFGDNLLLENSTVSGNSASGPGVAKGGGGGVFDGGNTSQYLNSTIASNSTDEPAAVGTPDTDGGGGVLLDNVVGGVVMANMTITGNSASQAAGGAINNNLITQVEISGSIVAGNSEAGDARNNCDSQTAGANAIVSEGYNLTDDGSCGFTATGDIVTANPLVGALHGNGGPAETEALLTGSPAIDGGNPAGCTDLAGNPLTTDERGVSRPQPPGGRCDIGAYERALPIISTSNAAVTGTTVLFGAMVSDPDPRAGTVSFEYGPTTTYGSTTASQVLPGSTASQTLIGSASGLAPGSYHFRAVATGPDGTTLGPDSTFTIAAPPSSPPPSSPPPSSGRPTPVAPSATAGKPTHVAGYTAVLTGMVNPNGETTSVQFQFGTTTSFSAHTVARSVGAGTSAKAVSALVTGLLPSRTYHVRVVATSSAGQTVSPGLVFKTGAALKPVSLGVKVTPRVDSRSPFAFHVTGRLGLPVGLSRAVGCEGTVSLLATLGKTVVATARGKVGRQCGYALKVTLKGRHLRSHGSALLLLVFGGNPSLKTSKSRPVRVKFGSS